MVVHRHRLSPLCKEYRGEMDRQTDGYQTAFLPFSPVEADSGNK